MERERVELKKVLATSTNPGAPDGAREEASRFSALWLSYLSPADFLPPFFPPPDFLPANDLALPNDLAFLPPFFIGGSDLASSDRAWW